MPLPPPGSPWPPPPYNIAWDQVAIHDAWWTGHPDKLSMVYGRYSEQDRPVIRPSQWRGGIVGTLSRWFWGPPAPSSDYPTRVHVPLAADIASTSAALLFGRPPAILAPEGASQAVADRVDDALNGSDVHSTLAEAAESAAALGGCALRVAWDTDVTDSPILDAVDADQVIPEHRWGRLQRLTIVTNLTHPTGDPDRTTTRWRHLECHEVDAGRAVIRHGLYEGTATNLGRAHPYDAHPHTAWLVDGVGGRLVEDTIDTGATVLTAAYLPNLRPNRAWRHLPELRALGRSDLAGIEPTLDRLDETLSSLIRDIGLAKARAIVPEWMLADLGPGKGSALDYEREIYSPVAADPRDSTSGAASEITLMQPDIRVVEHLDTMRELTLTAVRGAGYSPLTFGLPDEVAQTATEISAREKASLATTATKQRYAGPELERVLTAWMQVDAALFRGPGVTDPVRVEWPPAATDPLQVRAQTVELLHRAEAASLPERVRLVHPDWDEARVEEEVAAIKDAAPDPPPDPLAVLPPGADPPLIPGQPPEPDEPGEPDE